MFSEDVEKNSKVFWQEVESAILVRRWNGCVELMQGDNTILIEDDCFKEFMKVFKEMSLRDVVIGG